MWLGANETQRVGATAPLADTMNLSGMNTSQRHDIMLHDSSGLAAGHGAIQLLLAEQESAHSLASILSKLTAWELLLVVLLISLILVSIVGNCLVCIAIFTDRRLRKLGNAFIVSLAIADLFVSCLVMTFALCNDLMDYWMFGEWFCDIWISFDIMCCTASILNLCAISLDRFIHIKDCLLYNQLMTRRVAISAVIGIWIISALVSFVPINLGWHKPNHFKSPSASLGPAATPAGPLEAAQLGQFQTDNFWPRPGEMGWQQQQQGRPSPPLPPQNSAQNNDNPAALRPRRAARLRRQAQGAMSPSEMRSQHSADLIAQRELGAPAPAPAAAAAAGQRRSARARARAQRDDDDYVNKDFVSARAAISSGGGGTKSPARVDFSQPSGEQARRCSREPQANYNSKELPGGGGRGAQREWLAREQLDVDNNRVGFNPQSGPELRPTGPWRRGRRRRRRQADDEAAGTSFESGQANGEGENSPSPSGQADEEPPSDQHKWRHSIRAGERQQLGVPRPSEGASKPAAAHLPQCMLTLTPTYAIISSTISFYIPCLIMLGLYSKLFACARRHVRNIRAVTRAPHPICGGGGGEGDGASGASSAATSVQRQRGNNVSSEQSNNHAGRFSSSLRSCASGGGERSRAPLARRARTWLKFGRAGGGGRGSEPAGGRETIGPAQVGASGAALAAAVASGRQSGADQDDCQAAAAAAAGRPDFGRPDARASEDQRSYSLAQSSDLTEGGRAQKLSTATTTTGTDDKTIDRARPSCQRASEDEPLLGDRRQPVPAVAPNESGSGSGSGSTKNNPAAAANDSPSAPPGKPKFVTNFAATDRPEQPEPDQQQQSQHPRLGPRETASSMASQQQQQQQQQQQHKQQQTSQLATHKAAITLGIIMGTFLFCWVPFFCLNIIKAFYVDSIPGSMFRAFTWLGYANSALNPIIYGIHNSEFRNAFNRIFFKHLTLKNGRQYLNRRFSYDLRPHHQQQQQQQASQVCRNQTARPMAAHQHVHLPEPTLNHQNHRAEVGAKPRLAPDRTSVVLAAAAAPQILAVAEAQALVAADHQEPLEMQIGQQMSQQISAREGCTMAIGRISEEA